MHVRGVLQGRRCRAGYLLGLSGKTKVAAQLKLLFVVLLLVLTPLSPVLIFPVLLNRLLLTGDIM